MKVYIDCGAYNGDTLNCEERFNFSANYKIAFEPNPDFFSELSFKNPKCVDEIHNSIVWTEDKMMEFSVDIGNPPFGSTVMRTKKTWDKGIRIKAHAIDFAEFLKDLRSRVEVTEVLVKMDIEGAEFKVLEHLYKTGADRLIDYLYVETHEGKIPEYTNQDKDKLLAKLNCGEVHEWR